MVAVSLVSWLCGLAIPETYQDSLSQRDQGGSGSM
jgi:hypothetical protein